MTLLLFLLSNGAAWGQGCSDAGVCSMGAAQPGDGVAPPGSSVRASYSVGLGDHITLQQQAGVGARIHLVGQTWVSGDLPVRSVSGNLGTTLGSGDTTLSLTQGFAVTETRFALSVGARLHGNLADKTDETGRSLPMAYQTSLGSDDLLVGASVYRGRWHGAVGVQRVLGRNQNGFLLNRWDGPENLHEYFDSRRLDRGDDLMIRADRAFESGSWELFAGPLFLMRMQRDEITDADGTQTSLARSARPTVNLTGRARYYTPWEGTSVLSELGFPVVWRKVRADGLARIVVFTFSVEKRLGKAHRAPVS